jgi:hypothetical protein
MGKMTKLTKWQRETICSAVLRHRFSDQAVALVAERAAFAGEVYNDLYSASDRRKMAGLPFGWLPESRSVHVQFGDGRGYVELTFSGSVWGAVAKMLPEPLEHASRRILSSHRQGCAKAYDPTHALTAKYTELSERTEALSRDIDSAARQVNAAIASASTIGRLVEMWPEIEPFVSGFGTPPKTLPALPTDQLNAMLRLPVSEAA